MSETRKSTQLKNTSKSTSNTTAKKVSSIPTTKLTNGVTKPKTVTKLTTSTSRDVDDEKDKTKTSRTPRKLDANVANRVKAPIKVEKSVPKSVPKPSSRTTSTTTLKAKTTTNATTKPTITVKKRPTAEPVGSKPMDKIQSKPLRAKHSTAIVEAVKKNTVSANKRNPPTTTTTSTKPNAILDTYHNVTVASPPARRKERTETSVEHEAPVELSEEPVRPRTRTLDPEEVVVLRRDSAKQRIQDQIKADQEKNLEKTPVKEPVAFEVNFETPIAVTAKSREPSRTRAKNEPRKPAAVEDEQSNYSDDFESYESDFETGSSSPTNDSPNDTSEDSEEEPKSNADVSSESVSDEKSRSCNSSAIEDEDTDADNDDNKDDINDDNDAKANAATEETEDESELTQYPVTVIHRGERERERKLDSGNYEMNSRRHPKLSELATLQASSQQQFDSLETFSATTTTSEQLDSGISSYENAAHNRLGQLNNAMAFYGGYANFNTKPVLSKRGVELMSKIQFDTLTFTLFEMKPISYDIYMQTYGKLNTTQSAAQTHDNCMSADTQTDDCDMRSMWTQHPPQYDLQTVQRLGAGLNGSAAVLNCCGEEETQDAAFGVALPDTDVLEVSLQALTTLRQETNSRFLNEQLKRRHKPLNFERLNAFMLNSSLLMSKVLNSTENRSSSLLQKQSSLERCQQEQHSRISQGYFKLDTSFLSALRVVRIFANNRHNLVLTVHESLPGAEVYCNDFSNLLMVWSISECSKPIRLLSTWSEIARAEICNDAADILVCGLRDGSVAMWDLRETYSFCSKLDGHLTHFAATQSIVPVWGSGSAAAKRLVDLGAVVDVKSFRAPAKPVGSTHAMSGSYKSIQLASLNDTGILTVWTLVETAATHFELATAATSRKARHSPTNHSSKFEYSSPWARVKLIQSAICDLRDYLECGIPRTPSQFDKTKSLFQKNIYSDAVLRELNDTQPVQGQALLQGLRFTNIDTGCERIYVCTNRNFILVCSKSLKAERFRKITINESRFLFPTALRVLSNEDFLAVGLSNGSVMILNCNQRKALPPTNAVNQTAENKVTKSQDIPEIDRETGKSCAIQNIILNERRSFESVANDEYDANYELRPTTAACIAMITNQKKPFELRVYDQQLLLSGSVLRQHLVQSLELSGDGWRLFALSNGEVRIYDFYLDCELGTHASGSQPQKVIDIATARSGPNEQHLLILNANDDVEVHFLKQ